MRGDDLVAHISSVHDIEEVVNVVISVAVAWWWALLLLCLMLNDNTASSGPLLFDLQRKQGTEWRKPSNYWAEIDNRNKSFFKSLQ